MVEIKLVGIEEDSATKKFGEEELANVIAKCAYDIADDEGFWETGEKELTAIDLKLELVRRLIEKVGDNKLSPTTLRVCFATIEVICSRIKPTPKD